MVCDWSCDEVGSHNGTPPAHMLIKGDDSLSESSSEPLSANEVSG